MTDRYKFRKSVLESFGATPAETKELLCYGESHFDLSGTADLRFPLADERSVETWELYARLVRTAHSLACLSQYLPQLQFPVQEGISKHADYLAAVRRGEVPTRSLIATGLRLRAPQDCRLVVHATPAGRIPILIAGKRADFVTLVQAFTKRNEPVPIPESMGATMVSGYNNWDRIRRLRAHFLASGEAESSWAAKFQHIREQKLLYQDSFIIMSTGGYSGISSVALGLEEAKWRALSLVIRREHECAHYVTQRFFSSMRNNILDELLADFIGVTAALGSFRADWQLRFFGLERFPHYRRGGRLENYRGTPPLSEGAFAVLRGLAVSAVLELEQFDRCCFPVGHACGIDSAVITALASLTIEEIASNRGHIFLAAALRRATARLAGANLIRATTGNADPRLSSCPAPVPA
jgi:hypothetical protein